MAFESFASPCFYTPTSFEDGVAKEASASNALPAKGLEGRASKGCKYRSRCVKIHSAIK